MALTTTQLARVRRLIGDSAEPYMFTDDELNAIFGDNDDDINKTVYECYEVLLADASKRVTYRQGQSSQDDSDLFKHLEKLRDAWAKRAGIGLGTITTGALTFTFYDSGGDDIPPDDTDEFGWLLE